MFYIENEEKIILFDEDKKKLINTLKFMPQFKGLKIKETNRPIVDFQFADTKEYEEKKQKEERARLNNLSLTAADVERAIYRAKGMDFEDILELVSQNPPVGLDIKALKIELKANNFYRGNPYINQIGAILGFSEAQLDEFFDTKDYIKLTTPAKDDIPEAVLQDADNAPSDISKNVPAFVDNQKEM